MIVLDPGTKPWEMGWDAVAAIGTVLAVVVALWIALAAGRKERRERSTKAKGAVVAIWPFLVAIRFALYRIQQDDLISGKEFPPQDLTKLRAGRDALRDSADGVEPFGTLLSAEDFMRLTGVVALARYIARQIDLLDGASANMTIIFAFQLKETLPADLARAIEMVDGLVKHSEQHAIEVTGLKPYVSELQAGLDDQAT